MTRKENLLIQCAECLKSDIEQVEQLLSVGAYPDYNLRGTLRVNWEVLTKVSTELGKVGEYQDLLDHAKRLLNSETKHTTVRNSG
jgi:hypothetical protein